MNRVKKKNHPIISINEEKEFEKIQYHFITTERKNSLPGRNRSKFTQLKK